MFKKILLQIHELLFKDTHVRGPWRSRQEISPKNKKAPTDYKVSNPTHHSLNIVIALERFNLPIF